MYMQGMKGDVALARRWHTLPSRQELGGLFSGQHCHGPMVPSQARCRDDGSSSMSFRVAKRTHTVWLFGEVLSCLLRGQLDCLMQQWQKSSHEQSDIC